MKINCIVNQKGGTGKTTTAINLGCSIAQLNKKVLLIDFDPQSSLSYSLGITKPDYTTTDLLNGNTNYSLIEKEGVHILPADTHLADKELTLINKPGREQFLKKGITIFKNYDYIFIDSPPSLTLLTVNALVSAEQIIIPLQMEVLALQGLYQLLDTIKEVKAELNKELKIKGVLPCMYDMRRNLSAEILKEIKKHFKLKVFKTKIRESVRVAEAPSFSQSVLAYAPKSNGAKDYMKFAKEFIRS
jgi:chromosome partitioning protein